MRTSLLETIKHILRDISLFTDKGAGIHLREYQVQVARVIVDSVLKGKGLSFVVIFPRQSGKNELQAQIESYLLTILSPTQAEIVKVSPTWKPQSLNAMRRLERVLKQNLFTRLSWKKEQGYIYRNRNARIFFLSGAPTSNVVGATASTLLECDEAQDVLIAKWDKEIAPMAASTNATRVFWGTAWTSQTLLAREKRLAQQAQQRDGIQRLFELTADEVGKEVPAYRNFVANEIARHGRSHPFVRTQYFSEEIDSQSGFFPPARLALLQGEHLRQYNPQPHGVYAFLIDVAGQDEESGSSLTGVNPGGSSLSPSISGSLSGCPSGSDELGSNSRRDSTALTIVEIDLTTLVDESLHAPSYRIVDRRLWTGIRHSSLFAELSALINQWQPRQVVIDATGMGEGLYAFLDKAFPHRVIPFRFSQKSKSDLGWSFLSIIESGRLKDWRELDAERRLFLQQAQATQLEVLPGPGRLMRFYVPDGRRDPHSGELLHDDLVLSLSLAAVLDEQTWGSAESGVIPASDPLAGFKPIF
ncbi:MAG: hypothetical protein R6V73_11585 [Anaerolineales bacterium]